MKNPPSFITSFPHKRLSYFHTKRFFRTPSYKYGHAAIPSFLFTHRCVRIGKLGAAGWRKDTNNSETLYTSAARVACKKTNVVTTVGTYNIGIKSNVDLQE
jgi:hypothetical protein